MVPGTGVWDRDVRFGQGERSLVFKDLAQRMAARGLAVVRTDTRGVSPGGTGSDAVSSAALAGRTTTTMRDDLAAAYDWAGSPSGLGARCVILLAHSEGMHHVGRLAELGAPAPLAVIGIGADMEAPAVGFRWRFAERDAQSLEQMDADDDGAITNAEVRAGWSRTPAAVNGTIEPYLHPSGAWSDADLTRLRAAQAAIYDELRAGLLAKTDSDPWPDAARPRASYQWWKSWFLDEQPTGRQLARWQVPILLHYGSIDSQTDATRNTAAARAELPASLVTVVVHPGRGHTLGENVTYGPKDEALANLIADEAARLAESCQ